MSDNPRFQLLRYRLCHHANPIALLLTAYVLLDLTVLEGRGSVDPTSLMLGVLFLFGPAIALSVANDWPNRKVRILSGALGVFIGFCMGGFGLLFLFVTSHAASYSQPPRAPLLAFPCALLAFPTFIWLRHETIILRLQELAEGPVDPMEHLDIPKWDEAPNENASPGRKSNTPPPG